LPFVDEKKFLIVTQLVLSLHEVAVDPAATESTTVPAIAESIIEPLHTATDPTTAGAALTETLFGFEPIA
jgi:hypothetical protein